MIIKRGNNRKIIILTGMLHLANYSNTLKSVFGQESKNLEDDEKIEVGIKFEDCNQFLYRKDNKPWDPTSFNKLVDDLVEKVKQDEKRGDNQYVINEEMLKLAKEKEQEHKKIIEQKVGDKIEELEGKLTEGKLTEGKLNHCDT